MVKHDKLIIIFLIVVILILAMGILIISDYAKEDTKILIVCNSTISENESIEIKLMDLNNVPISNQSINITINDNSYSIITDDNGSGILKLNLSEGNYTINCTYYGNDNYRVNNTSKNITIKKETVSIQKYALSSSTYSGSEPEYGSDSYVDKWDESQRNDGSWAYLHDQPVKTDADGHSYKRMYDEDSGEGYWYQMDQNYED